MRDAVSAELLAVDAPGAERYRMACWSERELRWEWMDEGPGPWKPRKTAVDAIAKCLAWTGCTLIPDMQVVAAGSGEVVWRGLMTPFESGGEWHYTAPEAGPPIDFPGFAVAWSLAWERLREKEHQPVAESEAHRQLELGGTR